MLSATGNKDARIAQHPRHQATDRTADVALGVDVADPIPLDSEVPVEFAKRGVLVWRDTFASV